MPLFAILRIPQSLLQSMGVLRTQVLVYRRNEIRSIDTSARSSSPIRTLSANRARHSEARAVNGDARTETRWDVSAVLSRTRGAAARLSGALADPARHIRDVDSEGARIEAAVAQRRQAPARTLLLISMMTCVLHGW